MRFLHFLASFALGTTAFAASHEQVLSTATLGPLDTLAVGASAVVEAFPDGHGGSSRVRFTRIDVYAPQARVLASGPDGIRELPPSRRVQLIGDGNGMRVHLAFDRGLRNVVGSGSSSAGNFDIRSQAAGVRVQPSEDALPPGVTPQLLGNDDGLPNPFAAAESPIVLGTAAVAVVPRTATVAVDVDRELLVNRFGGVATANQNAARDWIADLFGSMNVMYQRDLDVTLVQGTVILRTGTTPYSIAANTAANGTDLDNFGSYWQANHGGVTRAFAMLLSGQMTSGNNASGIAWINSYCRTQSSGGSYSVNKVFTNAGIPVDSSARLVGHELGHNFGAYHTHCSSATNGAGPASSNTIDRCFNAEGNGCYTGAVSCPGSGPGAPKGTVMSYCNQGAPAGAACGQSVAQFHPAHVTRLSSLIAANTPACLATGTDLIFKNGFER